MFILVGKTEKHLKPQQWSSISSIVLMLLPIVLPLFSIPSLLVNTAGAQNATATISSINNNKGGVSYFTLWNDPTENAFSIMIPKGWTVQPYLGLGNSGVIRSLNGAHGADFIFNVTDQTVKDQIFFAWSGAYYQVPVSCPGGPEGMYFGWMHYCYRNAVDYVKEFVLPLVQRIHSDAQIVTMKDISFPVQGQTVFYCCSAASALFSYTGDSEQYLIGADVITGGLRGGPLSPGNWYVSIAGFSAPKSELQNVFNLAQMVFFSAKENKEWAIGENQQTLNRANIISNTQEAIENIINQHVPSGMSAKLAQAWSDETLGSSDWVSNTGYHYNLPNDFDHYWTDPAGNIAASNTDTSPGPDFTPLTRASRD